MFDSLVESGSHKDDLARKGSFFLGTFAIYAVILLALGVLSVYLYNESLPSDNLELMTMVAPVPVQNQPEEQPDKPAEAKPAEATPDRQVATRTEFVASALDPTKVPEKVSAVASKVPPVPPGGAVRGSSNTDPVGGNTGPIGPVGPGAGGVGGGGGAPVVVSNDDPEPAPPPKATPTPVPKPRAPISGGVLNGKAISKPQPAYPPIAKAARASGTVTVQVTVDESGKVISARAAGGHPLLQQAAVQAAYQARFSPTLLSGQPVKVNGVITYNFVLN
ncbi:MAG: periplasmic protein TonB [Pyrinomonadaceae bacterium]|jgi:protein TonB|nr:periplasmic protein TonB [Pyrinomonadaceae bacterium]